jgi:ring-1,2-phenylacetyl-CoA epoxidase subunit PaaC
MALLTELADDELTLGHRDSEWLGLAPDIEGDIAFSSIAQDEVGHATFFFERLSELTDEPVDPLAFARPVHARRNARLLERENGDWAKTIVRHYLYDVFDRLRLQALADSSYRPLAQGAVKMLREEHYHLLHMVTTFRRLASGGEARRRVERALQELADDVGSLFAGCLTDERVQKFGLVSVSGEELRMSWQREVCELFVELGLNLPAGFCEVRVDGDGRHEHTPALEKLLTVMSEVYQSNPAANW